MKPSRVQLSRRRGYRKPAGAVVVSRPSKWGNPFRPGDPDFDGVTPMSRARAVDLYRTYLVGGQLPVSVEDVRRELVGKALACWCRVADACHADVLIEIAATREPRR